MAHYLFVLTHDTQTDVSAAHLVRSALALRRRDHQTTLFLTDDAANAAPGDRLSALVDAGARVLVDCDPESNASIRSLPPGFEPGSSDELSRLLLTPGLCAYWC